MNSREYPRINFSCPKPPALKPEQRLAWCADCGKHVHNLSAISAREQEELIAAQPNACVAYRRVLWPAAAALMLGAGLATAEEQPSELPPVSESDEVFVLGGIGPTRELESIFLETAPEIESEDKNAVVTQAQPE